MNKELIEEIFGSDMFDVENPNKNKISPDQNKNE